MRSGLSTLYEWFARSADAFGEATALEVDGQRLSYTELRDLAERLAKRLVAANDGGAPARVALVAGRSVTAYAGYLAALRAGAAVVPMSPESPPARNASLAAAADVRMAIVADPRAGAGLGVPVVVAPDDLVGLPADPTVELPRLPATPDDVAYILSTSGSTGTPKVVPILHRNICAYLSQMVPRYGAGPGSRLSQAFELTFDGSVHDLFVAWGSGAALVVPTRAQLLSPVTFINARGLTHWFSVPSLVSFADRLGTLVPDSMPTLRWSLFGGEPLTLAQARAWHAAAPGSAVENLYGPTEGTIACARYRLPRRTSDWPLTSTGTVPIGGGLPSVELAVLDEDGRPGTVGELCLRGPQRFPGYLSSADNAGRFIPPGDSGGLRVTADTSLTDGHWYRTGDRVAIEDDRLVHVGRLDHQVKVRGHRIELGEIEARLREQAGVRDAVTVLVAGPDQEHDLAAAVTGVDIDPERLHCALGDVLPPYMLPRRIATFEDLPVSANGKVDRRAVTARLDAGPGR